MVKTVDACGETLDNVMFGDNQCDFWISLFTYHDAFACSEEEKNNVWDDRLKILSLPCNVSHNWKIT